MTSDSASAFLALHHRGPAFVLPNAWDAGSARLLELAGFEALGTTSAGIAFSAGFPDDGRIGRERMLDRVAAIVAAVDVPVSADMESGYGDDAAAVADTVRAVRDVGAVGVNLEDAVPGRRGALFGVDEAAERVAAARAVAPAPFTLNARIDSYLAGVADPFTDAVARAEGYVAAGADCVFVPGVSEEPEIARLVEAVDAPLNVVAGLVGEALALPAYDRLGVAA